MSNKTYGAGNGRMTPAKANMRAMAKNGGLAGFKNGGGTYDGLMKAQEGNEKLTENQKQHNKTLNSWGINPATLGIKKLEDAGAALSKFFGGTGLTVAQTKEDALLKAAKTKQRNPKPGPNEY